MRANLCLFLFGFLLWTSCRTGSRINRDSANYTHCDVENNFCVQYSSAVFPPPSAGRDKTDLILGLYSEKYDVKLLVSSDENAENLSFDQIYEQQLLLWKDTYDDVDIEGSNITDGGFEVNARGEGYLLYARSARFIRNGDIIILRLVGGPEMSASFFAELREAILLYPNK